MNFRRQVMVVVILIVFQLLHSVPTIYAGGKLPRIAMVYMTSDDLPNADVYFLEATVSAFTDEIVLFPANKIDPAIIQQSDVIVFVGNEPGIVPGPLKEVIQQFKGDIMAFGHNVEQLQLYDEWRFLGLEYIRSLDEKSFSKSSAVTHVLPPSETDILSVGSTLDEQIPFILKKGRLSYIASTSFGVEQKHALSRSLYTLLDQEPPTAHQAYIRLEEITPLSDPKLVKEIGDYLADRDIPFYMAITPVYVNPKTGDQTYFEQNKELVQAIKSLQHRGGMIIAHGYTDAYRYEEMGKSPEFWDDRLNQKITTEQPNVFPAPLKSRSAFASEEMYESYTKEINLIEKKYIDEKLTKSVEQLTAIGLYPLAFEAPEYMMSSTGYRVTSDYFSSIFGKIQFSDNDSQIMDAPLFASRSAILSGMMLYPETIGYIDPDLLDPYKEMELAVERLESVPGSMIGGFYHSYLGLEYLPRMIQLMESVPDMEWLDLSKTEQTVQTGRVTIKQEANGALQVTSSITKVNRLFQRLEGRLFDVVLWTLALVVTLFLIAFSTYILVLRARLGKRLFGERKISG